MSDQSITLNNIRNWPTDTPDCIKVAMFTAESTGVPDFPKPMTAETVKFMSRMVISELMEMAATVTDNPKALIWDSIETADPPGVFDHFDATKAEIIAEQCDGIVDIVYYAYNVLARHGINAADVFKRVHGANMAKRFPDGKFHKRDDGKIVKPDEWKEPDIVSIVEHQIQNGSWIPDPACRSPKM